MGGLGAASMMGGGGMSSSASATSGATGGYINTGDKNINVAGWHDWIDKQTGSGAAIDPTMIMLGAGLIAIAIIAVKKS